jgi:ribosomal protein S7
MKKCYRDLTAKYKAARLQPDALYLSRTVQTLFNKFTKKGKKALARKHIALALTQFRLTLRRPPVYNVIIRTFRNLRVPFQLLSRRQGRKNIEVPVPLRRNKGEAAIIQSLYNAIGRRRDRQLSERLKQELHSLTFGRLDSPTYRQRNLHLAKIYEERVHVERR